MHTMHMMSKSYKSILEIHFTKYTLPIYFYEKIFLIFPDFNLQNYHDPLLQVAKF